MRKIHVIVICVSIILSGLPAHSVTIGYSTFPDEQYVASNIAPGKGYIGFSSANAFELRMSTSFHVQYQMDSIYRGTNPSDLPQKIKNFRECRGAGTNCHPRQGKPDEDFRNRYVAVLPGCRIDSQTNCVQGLSATTVDGVKHLGNMLLNDFSGESLQNYVGNPAIDLPDGNSSFLVDIPGVPHAAGTKYLVVAELTSEMNEGDRKFAPARMQVGIFAVSINYASYPNRTYTPTDFPDSQHPYGAGWKVSPYGKISPYQEICVQHNTGACAVPQKLPLDATFSISLNLSVPVVGWFHGRVTDASLKISTITTTGRLYEITAKPVLVPMVAKWKRQEELTPRLKTFYAKQGQPLGGSGDIEKSFFSTFGTGDWSLMRPQTDFSENGMEEFLLWLEIMDDKAIATPSQWMIRSIDSGDNQCYSSINNVAGIVQTNATAYISGPPQFNRTENSLDYKVAGPHYLADGSLNQGTYDLLINKEVARCIYGFEKAPTKATVSILSADGKEIAQTISLSEKDDWIKLRATGFTYSAPVLRVKLQQEQPVVAVQVPSSAPATSTVTANTTGTLLAPKQKPILKVITCVKGSSTKYLEGKNPKCPKGYRKK